MDKEDLDGVDLAKRRWVRFEMPVLVCVDTDQHGDQHVRHVVPVPHEIEPAGDDQDIQVVYGPDGDQRVDRKEPAAWRAVSEAGHTRRRWVGERPDRDWDWLESPDDLLVEDQYAQEHPDGEDDEDQDEAV